MRSFIAGALLLATSACLQEAAPSDAGTQLDATGDDASDAARADTSRSERPDAAVADVSAEDAAPLPSFVHVTWVTDWLDESRTHPEAIDFHRHQLSAYVEGEAGFEARAPSIVAP